MLLQWTVRTTHHPWLPPHHLAQPHVETQAGQLLDLYNLPWLPVAELVHISQVGVLKGLSVELLHLVRLLDDLGCEDGFCRFQREDLTACTQT